MTQPHQSALARLSEEFAAMSYQMNRVAGQLGEVERMLAGQVRRPDFAPPTAGPAPVAPIPVPARPAPVPVHPVPRAQAARACAAPAPGAVDRTAHR